MPGSELGIYLSGAAAAGRTQRDVSLSLGGHRASDRAVVLTPSRVQAMPGIVVRFVSGNNGVGVGVLRAASSGSLAWTPPGGVEGAVVAVGVGEEGVLLDVTGEKWILVERVGSDVLAGSERMGLQWTFNTVFSGRNVSAAEAAAGVSRRAAVFLRNDGAGTISDITVWIDGAVSTAGAVAIAEEAADGDGAIQVIASDVAAPAGVSWVSPTTEGTGLDLGSLAAGAVVGLWIEVEDGPGAAAAAVQVVQLRISFLDSVAAAMEEVVTGVYGVAGAGQYELYCETSTPDPAVDTLRASGASKPLTWAGAALADGTYVAALYWRNEFGVLGVPLLENVVVAAGVSLGAAPSGPRVVSAVAGAGGVVRISASYYPREDADPGTHWRVWVTVDGTDPDPAVDVAAYEVAFSAVTRALLVYDFDAGIDDAVVRAVVRVVRDLGEAGERESVGPDVVVEATAVRTAPARVRARAMRGTAYGQLFSPAVAPDGDVEWVDEGENIRFVFGDGWTALWADTVLVWVLEYDHAAPETAWFWVPSEWDLEADSVAAAGSADAVEVVSWTGGDKRLAVNVNGSRRVEIDVSNMVITAENWEGEGSVPSVVPTLGGWRRYGDTLLTVWDREREDYRPGAVLSAAGGLVLGVALDTTLDQAGVESRFGW